MTAQPTPRARSVLGSRLGFWLLGGSLWALAFPAALRGLGLFAFNAAVLALFAWDRARLRRARLRVTRTLPRHAPLNEKVPYTLQLVLEQGPRLRLVLEDSEPENLSLTPFVHRLTLRPQREASVQGELCAQVHGHSTFEALAIRRETPLGLCAVIEEHPAPGSLRVYPELPWGNDKHLRFRRREPGPIPSARHALGEGGEVERLREYVPTDSMRNIDWKATAKRGRPITRAYEPERAQTLWIVLDASRVMTLESEARAARDDRAPRTRFEAALEAALTLADAALRDGDRVGLLVYHKEAKLCVLPGRGRAHFLRIVEACLDAHAEPCELDAEGLVRTLGRTAPRRSLLVLFSDLDSQAGLGALARSAQAFARRHLTLCVSLTPERLWGLERHAVHVERDVYLKLSARSLLDQRAQLGRSLRHAGLDVLETSASTLASSIVARYLRDKRGGRI